MALSVWRLFNIPIQRTILRSIASETREPDFIVSDEHIYKKTYTPTEIIRYFKDNVAYTDDLYIVTSMPQGIKFLPYERWNDTERDTVCKSCLQSMIPGLRHTFHSQNIFISKHPRSNSSGLLVLAKNFQSFSNVRKYVKEAQKSQRRIITYLAVVMGSPKEVLHRRFKIDKIYEGNSLFVQILEEKAKRTHSTEITNYRHEVIDSAPHVSLVKISVSHDGRDCVRHILAQRSLTPVFGDFWNLKRTMNSLFGAPLVPDIGCMTGKHYDLPAEIYEQLNITPDEQKCIPIHLHLYGLKLQLPGHQPIFVTVPPPESFVWTCHRLGLHEIKQFAPPDDEHLTS